MSWYEMLLVHSIGIVVMELCNQIAQMGNNDKSSYLVMGTMCISLAWLIPPSPENESLKKGLSIGGGATLFTFLFKTTTL